MRQFIAVYLLLLPSFYIGYAQSASTTRDTLCTPNPSKEAVALYRYLLDMKGKKILSGQMDSSWGIDEFDYIKTNTGKQPAIKGMDFIHQNDNANEVKKAIDWWNTGGIPTIMWHWGAPTKGDGYEQSKMAIDIDNCFVEGTAEYKAFWAELKLKADLLQKLEDANVPVIWRPYHELNGNWFWWGKQGSTKFKKLWVTMFDYFVKERGLNNLIWVLCYTGNIDGTWYPGDQYVDVAGGDTYGVGEDPQTAMYNNVKKVINDRFPIAYHECGVPPNPDKCLASGAIWSWWMEWHTNYLTDIDKTYLKKVYDHDLIITLDEVPNIMEVYGWKADSCRSSLTIPQMNIDNSGWIQKSIIQVGSGNTATINAQTNNTGTLSWSGLGTSGNSEFQTINLNSIGTATATFINSCGATSTTYFYVGDFCPASTIEPYMQIEGKSWLKTDSLIIAKGQTVKFAPKPASGGSWKWSGGITGTTRSVSYTPDSSCIITATYINTCGTQSKQTFNIVIQSPAGLSQFKTNPSISIYPSPCTNELNIGFSSANDISKKLISIYSLNGAKMFEKFSDNLLTTIDVSTLNPGIYQLNIDSPEGKYSESFIKKNN